MSVPKPGPKPSDSVKKWTVAFSKCERKKNSGKLPGSSQRLVWGSGLEAATSEWKATGDGRATIGGLTWVSFGDTINQTEAGLITVCWWVGMAGEVLDSVIMVALQTYMLFVTSTNRLTLPSLSIFENKKKQKKTFALLSYDIVFMTFW